MAQNQKQLDQMSDSEKLVESERLLREGIATVKDIIAPTAMRVNPDYMTVGNRYARTLFVYTFPRFLRTNWLSPIININFPFDIAMFIYPTESAAILKNLRNKVAQIQSTINIQTRKGAVRDPLLETALQDVETLRDVLQQGTERFFRFSLYITLFGTSKKDLDKKTEHIETLFGSKLVYTKRTLLQSEQGFNSTLPLANDELHIVNNLNTTPLSTMFPFVSVELSSNDGILYGINQHNNSLVLFDRFSLENYNSVIFAKSGAGKSYATKLEILRSMMFDTDVIAIDPENEYQYLAEAVGGSYINIELGAESRINPLDLPRTTRRDETMEDILRASIIRIKGLLRLMIGELNPEEDALTDRAIKEAYAKKDITEDTDLTELQNLEMPLLSDLEEVLNSMEGGESIAIRLTKYTTGTFSGLLNNPTNANVDKQMVVFSIRNLEDELRPIGMYLILGHIWNLVRTELKKRLMVVDEAWWMMQNEDSAKFLFSIAKRARKYYLGVATITQDVDDFLVSQYGRAIVANSSLQLLMKQSRSAINHVADVFQLTDSEKMFLLEAEVGEGIFFAGRKHVAIKVVASYQEDQIITSDPRQLLEIERAKEEFKRQQTSEETF